MKLSRFQRIRLISTGIAVLLLGSINAFRDYRAKSSQAALDWAAHPYATALGLFLPVILLSPILYWYLGKAKWFKQAFLEKPRT
jgi:hypothetical protein